VRVCGAPSRPLCAAVSRRERLHAGPGCSRHRPTSRFNSTPGRCASMFRVPSDAGPPRTLTGETASGVAFADTTESRVAGGSRARNELRDNSTPCFEVPSLHPADCAGPDRSSACFGRTGAFYAELLTEKIRPDRYPSIGPIVELREKLPRATPGKSRPHPRRGPQGRVLRHHGRADSSRICTGFAVRRGTPQSRQIYTFPRSEPWPVRGRQTARLARSGAQFR
jgi:hypothetical protein